MAIMPIDTYVELPKPMIMVVEDNPINQKLTVVQLSRMGYSVHAVANGKDAVEAFSKNPSAYGLVLMDCYLPLLNGFDAASEIRKFENLKGRKPVPIIAVTASPDPSDRDESFQSGMDDYICKPVGQQQLRIAVERWMPLQPV